MKNNKLFKAAATLMGLTLITTCFVGGTFAKYTTTGGGSDTAHVAKFGVTIDAETDVFAASYDNDAVKITTGESGNIIAPGTSGTAAEFTISGTPEVKVNMTVTLGNYTMVTLPAGTYKDYTTAEDDEYKPTENYYPVKWTLTKSGELTPLKDKVELSEIEEYFEDISQVYAPGAALTGTYTLEWEWPFEGNDQADTVLGNFASDDKGAPQGYEANESFNLSIKVEQVNN